MSIPRRPRCASSAAALVKPAAQFAYQLAAIEIDKVEKVQDQLAALAPAVPDTKSLLEDARRQIKDAITSQVQRSIEECGLVDALNAQLKQLAKGRPAHFEGTDLVFAGAAAKAKQKKNRRSPTP